MPGFTADRLLLFGATGDLSRRMLLPSLCALDAEGLLDPRIEIVGTARSDLDDQGFRNFARASLEQFLPADRRGGMATFLNRLSYQALDASQFDGFDALAAKVGTPREGLAIFLSTAPTLFEPTIRGLAQSGIAGERSRIGLEKPLGIDLESSKVINDAVAAAFPENRIYRIDHYLGKETVQNLLALRFANLLFEPLWNAPHIDHVQITVAETVGLESRVAYYDDSGAIRDMVQNHMLQLLALVAMEPPVSYEATAVRDEKVKVLRSLRKVAASETVTGQYRAGAIGREAVPGYDDELGKDSDTETFVAIKAHIDNWRWKGVPFYLRTGKRLPRRTTEIVVQFRDVPHSIFGSTHLTANRLTIRLQPEEDVSLLIMNKTPTLGEYQLQPLSLNLSLLDAFKGQARRRIAYERLMLEAITNNSTLFVRRDEAEAAWLWIDRIMEGWNRIGMKPAPYAAGTWGPAGAFALTERNGHNWQE